MLNNDNVLQFNKSDLSSVLNESIILQQLPEGRVIVFDTIPSTNQYLIDNIEYIKSGDAIVTENQTQGRGRCGKIWITPKGQSICLSIYWKLYKRSFNIMVLSIIISVIVSMVLKNFGVAQIKIKWPNDLYVHNRKLAGILVEILTQNNYVSHLIIGIGINISISVCTKLEIQISENWIDLNYLGIFPNRNILVAVLVKTLRKILSQFEYNQDLLLIDY